MRIFKVRDFAMVGFVLGANADVDPPRAERDTERAAQIEPHRGATDDDKGQERS